MVENPAIYVNKGAFILDDEDFSDLIPITVRHEIAEFWTYVKTGYSFSPAPPYIGIGSRVAFAHGLALREEYFFAFELGKAERYLDFVKRLSDQKNIRDNEMAYKIAKSRFERKSIDIQV